MKGPAPRRAAVVLAVLAFAPPAAAAPALVRLAEGFAAEVVRAAKGRPVEVAVPEDRTGRGASLALDLHALVLDRLQGRAIIRGSGPRLRVRSVLSETITGLVLSARVVEEPGDRLVDLLSVSAPVDESVLALSPWPAPPGPGAIDVRSTGRTSLLDEPVLDLAFFGDERLVVLGSDAVALYRLDEGGLTLDSRWQWPGPLDTVRLPGGLLRVAEKDAAFWALTSRAPRALLFAVEERSLALRQEADALPWPASPAGLRYRAGTNLIEGSITGLGPGPFLGLDDSAPGLAVSAEGALLGGGAAGPAAGPALAALWPGIVAVASAQPPGEDDAILVVGTREGPPAPRVLESIRVDGAVRALAARARGESMRLVAAVEDVEGGARLLVMDLARLQP
jgi:hypothetical protein